MLVIILKSSDVKRKKKNSRKKTFAPETYPSVRCVPIISHTLLCLADVPEGTIKQAAEIFTTNCYTSENTRPRY